MAKERLNRPKQQKKPLKSVLKRALKICIFFLIAFSITFVVYLVDRSKLLEPSRVGLTAQGRGNVTVSKSLPFVATIEAERGSL